MLTNKLAIVCGLISTIVLGHSLYAQSISNSPALVKYCDLDDVQKQEMLACRDKYRGNNCGQLIEAGLDANNINSCLPTLIRKVGDARQIINLSQKAKVEVAEMHYECARRSPQLLIEAANGTIELIEATPEFLSGIPRLAQSAIEGFRRIRSDCQKKVLAKETTDIKSRNSSPLEWIKDRIDIQKCIKAGQRRTLRSKLNATKEIAKKVAKTASEAEQLIEQVYNCTNIKGKVEYACPLLLNSLNIAGLVSIVGIAKGVGISKALKHLSLNYKASRLLKKNRKYAGKLSELVSLDHQKELLDFIKDARVKAFLGADGVDPDSLIRAILDSDLGKLSAKSNKFFDSLADVDLKKRQDFFNALQLKSDSPAGNLLAETFSRSKYSKLTILNKDASMAEINSFFKSPLAKSYFHEYPGMGDAVHAFNKLKAPTEQDKKAFLGRFLGNFGHNGPNEGFWGNQLSVWMTGATEVDKELVDKVFKNTVYQPEAHSGGRRLKYGPLDIKGQVGIYYHIISDRASQAGALGQLKILLETGGEGLEQALKGSGLEKSIRGRKSSKLPKSKRLKLGEIGLGPKGVDWLKSILVDNPEGTLKQLSALEKHLESQKELIGATAVARLIETIGISKSRIIKEQKFLEENILFTRDSFGKDRITVKLSDTSSKVFTNDGDPADVLEEVNRVLKKEALKNGNILGKQVENAVNIRFPIIPYDGRCSGTTGEKEREPRPTIQ